MKILIGGIALVLVVETMVLGVGGRSIVLVVTGVAVAFALLSLRWWFIGSSDEPVSATDSQPAESLQRWRARTEIMIAWADGNRGAWDRHLRPILAREFSMATGHRPAKNPAAHDAAGRMLFGSELWEWVDPSAASHARRDEPAPGRAALDEILERLESI